MKKWLRKRLRSILLTGLVMVLSVGLYVLPSFGETAGVTLGSINYAQGGNTSTGVTDQAPQQPWMNDPERQNAGFGEKIVGDMVAAMLYALEKSGIDPIDKLVFGEDNAALDVFAITSSGHSEFEAIQPVYSKIDGLAWFFLVAVLMWLGVKVARGQNNPRVRANMGSMMIDVMVGIFIMGFSWLIVSYSSEWNILLCQLMNPSTTGIAKVHTGDYFLSQIVNLLFVGQEILINIMYLLRKFLLMGSVLIGPFIGLAYSSGNKQPFSIWFSETITNAFMPLSHALVFSLYFSLANWAGKNQVGLMAQWYAPIVVVFFLIPVSAYFRRIFSSLMGQLMGMSEEGVSKSALGASSGLSGAAKLAGSLIGGNKGGGLKAALGMAKGNLSGGSNGGILGGGAPSGGPGGSGGATGGSMASTANTANPSASIPGANGIGQVSQASYDALGQGSSGYGGMANNTLPESHGIQTLQDSIGGGQRTGAKVAGFAGRLAGGAVGLAADVAMLGAGQRTNFRSALSNAGGNIGGRIGGALGGVGGAVRGTVSAIDNERARSNNPIGTRQAFNQAMGLRQPRSGTQQIRQSAARAQLAGTLAGAAFGQPAATRMGNTSGSWAMNRGLEKERMRKGLEPLGNVKKR